MMAILYMLLNQTNPNCSFKMMSAVCCYILGLSTQTLLLFKLTIYNQLAYVELEITRFERA